ncbi:hypothetical protein SSP531S_04280 [Streptomyces spongiicola]|uniref:Uncharacterized protein n=1 Tax=Streptomyces spongiicola TaxID=1690221 RepID=A0A388SSD3_9ACTN|nr:hypothetical protein SSP531S_04280 [Streptomyces spongiicola]
MRAVVGAVRAVVGAVGLRAGRTSGRSLRLRTAPAIPAAGRTRNARAAGRTRARAVGRTAGGLKR